MKTPMSLYNEVFKKYLRLVTESKGIVNMDDSLVILLPICDEDRYFSHRKNETPLTAIELIRSNFKNSSIEFKNISAVEVMTE